MTSGSHHSAATVEKISTILSAKWESEEYRANQAASHRQVKCPYCPWVGSVRMWAGRHKGSAKCKRRS